MLGSTLTVALTTTFLDSSFLDTTGTTVANPSTFSPLSEYAALTSLNVKVVLSFDQVVVSEPVTVHPVISYPSFTLYLGISYTAESLFQNVNWSAGFPEASVAFPSKLLLKVTKVVVSFSAGASFLRLCPAMRTV